MEPTTPTIWSRLLTKRQRSSLSPPVVSDVFVHSDTQGKNPFFLTPPFDADPLEFHANILKKVKIQGNDKPLTNNLPSPSTRIDENSPNLTACFSPPVKFNECLLGSPAHYELDRDIDEEPQTQDKIQLEYDCENEKLKEIYEINKEISAFLEQKQAKLMMDKEIFNVNHCFLIQCCFNHIWETCLLKLRNHEWCHKCTEKYKKCLNFAASKNWTLITETFLPNLSFRCHLGHIIEATSKNYEHKVSCLQCKKIAREEYMKHLKEEEEKKFQERKKYQERLFEESKRKSDEEHKKCKEINSKPILEAYKQIKIEMEPLAQKYANEYIEKKNADAINLPKYLEVYKILLIPDDILKLYLSSLETDSLKKEYRSLAKQIHPDKNNHPKAAGAFQKLNKLYEEVLKPNKPDTN